MFLFYLGTSSHCFADFPKHRIEVPDYVLKKRSD